MKNLKYIIPTLTVVIIAVGVFIISPFNSVSANPDYICIKDVNRTCEITNTSLCSEWINGSRNCEGTRTTKVSYFLTRTTCEAGYTQIKGGGHTGGASGRKTSDTPYASENCSITQTDKTPPVGDSNVSNK